MRHPARWSGYTVATGSLVDFTGGRTHSPCLCRVLRTVDVRIPESPRPVRRGFRGPLASYSLPHSTVSRRRQSRRCSRGRSRDWLWTSATQTARPPRWRVDGRGRRLSSPTTCCQAPPRATGDVPPAVDWITRRVPQAGQNLIGVPLYRFDQKLKYRYHRLQNLTGPNLSGFYRLFWCQIWVVLLPDQLITPGLGTVPVDINGRLRLADRFIRTPLYRGRSWRSPFCWAVCSLSRIRGNHAGVRADRPASVRVSGTR